ncbi:MAG: hypothetical protein KKA42_13595, partial [candidate division Zixibacteria bacterium]|nr:hypothetical protein [candidate division Zixibacteria bacterium]
ERVVAETLSVPYPTGVGAGRGLQFRGVTGPFCTAADTLSQPYQINVRVSDGEMVTVRKFARTVEPGRYTLMLADTGPGPGQGLPSCLRMPKAKVGDTVRLVIPATGLPP